MTAPSMSLTFIDGQTAASFAAGDYAVVMGCGNGTLALNTPTVYASKTDLTAATAGGKGPGPELAARILDITKKPVIFIRLPGTTAGRCSQIEQLSWTGTSVITFSVGTSLDSFEGRLYVVTGGTIGTTGCVVKYSLDAGRTWSQNINLGTANTCAIPESGLTLSFAGGTLVAGEVASWWSYEPRWTASDLAAAYLALRNSSYSSRFIAVAGHCLQNSDVTAHTTQLDSDAASPKNKFRGAFLSVRDQTFGQTTGKLALTFVDGGVGTDSITRAAGSFVDDGFVEGQTLTVATALNSWSCVLGTVAAMTLTVPTGTVVAEVGVTGRCKAIESISTWKTSVGAAFTAEHRRAAVEAGSVHLPNHTTAIAWKLRRPRVFADATRFWKHDQADSLADVSLGPLDEASIRHTPVSPEPVSNYGQLAEYEETTDAALDSLGFNVSWEIPGLSGVYTCHPYIRCPAGSSYNRVHHRANADLGAELVNSTLKRKLSTRLALDPATGYLAPEQRKVFEEAVLDVLRANLLELPSGQVPRCSAVSFALSATDDLRASSASRVVHYTASCTSQGYAEDFSGSFALI